MKVRILKQPVGKLNGVALNLYKVGHTYDMPSAVATYLVVEGFAQVEMRRERNQGVPIERRKNRE